MPKSNGFRFAEVLKASSALLAPLLALALAAPQPASAQSASDKANTVQEVVVTGTMFRTKRESASPLTVMTDASLADAGITTTSDAIRSISADNSGTIPTAFGIGFAAGSSGVALRGLTVNSTLVLIDGLRTANYGLADDGERGFVDLNTIPEEVIDHVDVYKDGASSLYGADAIGGVVNIVFKPTYKGEEASAEAGTSQHGGGTMQRFTGLLGVGDLDSQGFNGYFSFEYQHDDRIRVSQRGFPFNTGDYTSFGGLDTRGGQPGNFSGSIYGSVSDAVTGGPTQVLRPGGCGPLGIPSTDGFNNFCEQNFSLYGDDQPAETRWGVYSRFTWQLDAQTTAYVSFSYFDNHVHIDTAPSQIEVSTPHNTDLITLPAHLSGGGLNPNDPFAALGHDAFINYAFGDIPASGDEHNHVIRLVGDLKGRAAGWDWDLAAVFAYTSLDTVNAGFINYNQLLADIADGSYSFINPDSNSASVRQALAPNLVKTSTTDLDTINFQATRSLMDLEGGPLSLGFGAAWRYESTHDPDLNPNLSAQGLGIAHTIGKHSVASAFAELDAPFTHMIDVDLGARFDHYSDFGNNFSPKATLKFIPIPQVMLRGTYALGFRAPSFAENGSSASEGFTTFQVSDPGFITAHGGDAYSTQPYPLAFLTLANPNIKPEKSTSYTVGGVFQPISSLSFSVDYWWIRKTQVITAPSPFDALNAYFAGAPIPAGFIVTPDVPDPAFPAALPRPVVVGAAYINANSLLTDGVDFNVRFKHPLPWDMKIDSNFDLTDLLRWQYSQPGLPTLDYVGLQSPYILSSGAGTPKWRADWQTTLSRGPASASVTVYYVSGLKEITSDVLGPGICASNVFFGIPESNCTMKSFTYANLHLDYKVTDKIDVYGDVLNFTDAKPPFDPIDYAGVNYNPTFAQAGIIGRYFKIGVRAKF
jgi:iron complex outermembrane receptor protein